MHPDSTTDIWSILKEAQESIALNGNSPEDFKSFQPLNFWQLVKVVPPDSVSY